MKITPKKDSQNFSLPLPIFHSVHIADAISKEGEEFDVLVGLNKEQVGQLKKLSLDKNDIDIQNHTGDRERFGKGLYEEWYALNRTPFCLIHKRTDALTALVWFGRKDLGKKSIKFGKEEIPTNRTLFEHEWHTVSCRSYPPFRGTGLMQNFTQFSMDTYKKQFTSAMFWTGMDDRNKPIVRLMTKLEFEVDKENSDLSNNWLVMTKK
ncbi:MAG: hypothetical protein P4L63_03555 [Candidatus Pacebacteria bacterium]|nr:hypothetical protein [Candidatus Paceibacterota bacterium]